MGVAPCAILDKPTAGTIRIAVHHDKTAMLECGRCIDALQLAIGDIVSPLWTGRDPRRRRGACCRRDRGPSALRAWTDRSTITAS